MAAALSAEALLVAVEFEIGGGGGGSERGWHDVGGVRVVVVVVGEVARDGVGRGCGERPVGRAVVVDDVGGEGGMFTWNEHAVHQHAQPPAGGVVEQGPKQRIVGRQAARKVPRERRERRRVWCVRAATLALILDLIHPLRARHSQPR